MVMFGRFERPVRCQAGHVFTTIWVPLGSLKAARLGRRRFQYCPIGRHWTIVRPIDRATAKPAELAEAASVHDVRIP